MKFLTTAFASLVLSALGGCGWSIGSSTQEQIHKATLGQQLMDLKKAHDSGAINDPEYSKKRTELIDAALAEK